MEMKMMMKRIRSWKIQMLFRMKGLSLLFNEFYDMIKKKIYFIND